MKKTLLLISLALALVLTSNAQTEFRGWTVKAGANYSTFVVGAGSNISVMPKAGFVAGLSFDWAFGSLFGVSVDALYSTQGSVANLSFLKQGVEIQENVSYLNIPVQANIYIAKGLIGKAGLQLSYVLTATDEIRGTDRPQDFDLISRYNAFDLSVPVSLAYEFNFGMVIEARYNFGITNIVNEANKALSDFKAYNSFATVTLGYRF